MININEVIKKDYPNISGLIIRKNDKIMHEAYFNGRDKHSRLHIASITKSIVSILFGIAIDKKIIRDVNQPILEFFPSDHRKKSYEHLKNITIEDMLAMRVNYRYRYTPYTQVFQSDDWVKTTLDLLKNKEDKGFNYTPVIGPDIISGILVNATNQSMTDFAYAHLFKPLHVKPVKSQTFTDRKTYTAYIKNESEPGWIVDPKGTHTAGWGLCLSTSELDKIGTMLIDDKQKLISKKWLDASFSRQNYWKDKQASYGYYWWTDVYGGVAAIGDSGNLLFVDIEKKIVISILCEHKPRAKDSLAFISKYVLKDI